MGHRRTRAEWIAAERVRLIDWIATNELVQDAIRYDYAENLPAALGLDRALFDLACRSARVNYGVARMVQLDLFVPWELARCTRALAASYGPSTRSFLRSLLHAVLQTTREPARRALRGQDRWKPLNDQAAERRKRLVEAPSSGRVGRGGWWHPEVLVSKGLAEALEARAAACEFARNRHQYAICWIADYCDGLLVDLPIQIVKLEETFATAEHYVLPRTMAPT